MSLSLFLQPTRPEPMIFELIYGPELCDLFFNKAQLISSGDGSEVYRGRFFWPSDHEGEEAVCKIAYRSAAMSSVDHEAKIYTTKLQHLQGICVPKCFGYFVNIDQKNPMSCTVLKYCGEPIQKTFLELDVTFKTALVHAAVHIHDAGVKHNAWSERHVLDFSGLPMIVGMGSAKEHKCKRSRNIVQGTPAPQMQDFKCNELYQLCKELNYWKPGMIKYMGGDVPITMDLSTKYLVATAPKYVPREVALKAAKVAIERHLKCNYPEKYNDWQRKQRDLALKARRITPPREAAL
ncbi:hypothetical protein EVG20_g6507 [Dentipellis fragilis]|uniref:Protein kinase domain-containing protein n=1 Tax=Dentipellis fragilis TaxID=205917 RepID=A0A4Y9YMQ2_9AGAM|nr:hypothetical protein EVG20_g6507 [Dentipellis fragilis]